MPKRTDKPETTEAVPDEVKEPGVLFLSNDEVMSVYSNFVQLTVTPFDFGLRFAQLVSGPKPVAKEVVRVLVSPQTAKAIMRLMERQIASYETNHGEIPDLVKTLDVDFVRS
jgi:Protein of unknown function (DUF3467)